MKLNRWTLALASTGVVSLASVAYAEEQVMSQVLTAVSSTTLSGYVDTSAIVAFGPLGKSGADGSNAGGYPGYAFANSMNLEGFNLDVVSLTVEKPLSEDNWAAGYRAQMIYGPWATGYNYSVNSGGNADLAVKEAYVNMRVPVGNGLDFKMGVFNTVIGYEAFDSYLDPNFSRSYGWQLEPTQQTGLLATYAVSEAVSVSGGVADTWFAVMNYNPPRALSYLGSITVTAPESMGFLSGSAFYAGIVSGFSGNTDNTINYYVGTTMKTGVEGLSIGGALDVRDKGLNTVTPGDNWAFALAGYLSYQATEKWKLNGRVDWTQGSDGTFFDAGTVGISDEQNKLIAFTVTADYALWANVISRLEARWDTSLTGDRPYAANDLGEDGTKNAVTLALNVIYKF